MYTREQLESNGFRIKDVRFEDEVRDLESAIAERPPKPGGILFYGDSDIAFWRKRNLFAEEFAGLPAFNHGFGGARSWEALFYFAQLVTPCDPAVVVYCAGDNDLCSSMDVRPEQITTSIRLLLNALATCCPHFSRLVYLPLHVAPRRLGDEQRQDEANRQTREVLETHPAGHYAEYMHLLQDRNGELRSEAFAADGLHFSEHLYRELSAWLRPTLESYAAISKPIGSPAASLNTSQ